MKYHNGQPIFTATDLSNHIACRHATHLERQRALGKITKPVRKNQFLDRIIERGNVPIPDHCYAHERSCCDLDKDTTSIVNDIIHDIGIMQ